MTAVFSLPLGSRTNPYSPPGTRSRTKGTPEPPRASSRIRNPYKKNYSSKKKKEICSNNESVLPRGKNAKDSKAPTKRSISKNGGGGIPPPDAKAAYSLMRMKKPQEQVLKKQKTSSTETKDDGSMGTNPAVQQDISLSQKSEASSSCSFVDEADGNPSANTPEFEFDEFLLDVHLNDKGEIRDMEMDLINDLSDEFFDSNSGSNNGLSKASKNVYDRYQQFWKDYCKKFKIAPNQECNDVYLLGFFTKMKRMYKPSTLWVIYSCINRYFRFHHNKNLRDVYKIQSLLKNNSSCYVAKKSKVFTPEQMHKILVTCMEQEDDTSLTLMGVGTALLYFGLLRSCDVLSITTDDVQKNNEGKYEVRFEHMRKRKNSGFTYTLPAIYTPLFDRYIKENNPKKGIGATRFLKNWNRRAGSRIQNTGINTIRSWVKTSCTMLGLSDDGYTGHLYRRSAATNLADAGVSFINLKRHGQWKSDAVVEGYIANSLPMRKEREQCLLPANLRSNGSNEANDPNYSNTKVTSVLQKNERKSITPPSKLSNNKLAKVGKAPIDQVINLKGLGIWKYSRVEKCYVPLKKDGKPVPTSKECVPSPSPKIMEEEVVAAESSDDQDKGAFVVLDEDIQASNDDTMMEPLCYTSSSYDDTYVPSADSLGDETVSYQNFDSSMNDFLEMEQENNDETNDIKSFVVESEENQPDIEAAPCFSQLIVHQSVLNAKNTSSEQHGTSTVPGNTGPSLLFNKEVTGNPVTPDNRHDRQSCGSKPDSGLALDALLGKLGGLVSSGVSESGRVSNNSAQEARGMMMPTNLFNNCTFNL